MLYPLCKCAEIKRNASEKWELQGNRELAGCPPGLAVMAKCQSAVCQHLPQPQNPPQRWVVRLPSVLATGTDRAGLLWGQTGLLSTSFHLEIIPFPLPLGPWGKSPLGPGGIFLLRPNFNCVYPQSSTFSVQELEKTPD